MRSIIIVLLAGCAATASAQAVGNYLGPGVLTHGASTIGQRSGQDVDLRFFANATAIYDTGITPISVDSTGAITNPGGLFGVQVGLGAYGRHTFRRSVLGLDYTGNYRHYQGHTYYNGSNQQLALGYTYQKSRRIVFDFQGIAGTASYATAYLGGLNQVYDTVIDQTTLLFDNRVNYVQGGMDTNFILNSRTVFTAGGSAFMIRRQSQALIGMNGYNMRGSLQHRLSQTTTIGATFTHMHYDYPRAFGESDINITNGFWTRQLGRNWNVNLQGGFIQVEVQGQQRETLDPAIADILGINSVVRVFYRKNVLPSVNATLTHRWRNAMWNATYRRGISGGNGVYLTSRQETAGSSISYTGVRKWSFSVSGNYATLTALGQNLALYRQIYGTTTASYALTRSIQLTAGYTYRHFGVSGPAARRDSSRTQFSIYFSPGEVPISFH